MSVHIRFLQAHHGDCILVTVEDDDKTTRILIDGGPSYTFRPRAITDSRDADLKKVLTSIKEKGGCIDLVILTHVDDDHIGGLIKAFESREALPAMAKRVIFNSGSLIHEYFKTPIDSEKDIQGNFEQLQETSIAQGNTLERLLLDKGIWHREVVQQGNRFDVDGCRLVFLAPNENELQALLAKWVKEDESQLTSESDKDWKFSYETLLDGDSFTQDKSVTNGSSLSFILNVGEKHYVFLGDSHPETVVEGLVSLGYSSVNPLVAELVKVSHHGSKSNTNLKLLQFIQSSRYVISTNGLKHGLPNKVTLARIHKVWPESTIFFNYVNLPKKIYSDIELKELGGRVQGIQEEFNFA